MPKRPIDLHQGEFYHIYNRGAAATAIFAERDNYLFFLRRFRKKVPAKHVTTLAYCLMPNHYHLLVRLESGDFSERMQAFGTSYSKAINKQTGRSGALFQGRFKAKHVDNESYLIHLSRYIHLNPYEARLVGAPADWEFSSYREYLGTRAGTLPNTEIVFREFRTPQGYRDFVEDNSGDNSISIGHLLFDE